MSRIGNLPTELILLIASFLLSESYLAALALSSRRLYGISNRYLYQYNVLHGNSSALDWAAQNGQMATLQKALDAGAPLAKKQVKGKLKTPGPIISQFGRKYYRSFRKFPPHPISLAASAGHINIVRYMIDRGVIVNMSDPDGFTLLALAAIHGYASLAKYLLEVGARQGIRSVLGHRPMGDKTDKDNLMTEALFAAVLGGWVPVVKVLFTYGVNMNFHFDGRTPLCIAATNGMGDLVSLLLAYGASPDLPVGKRRSDIPLTAAVIEGHEDIVRMLVNRTASVHRTRALAFAVSRGSVRLAEILLQRGAPPEFCPSEIPKSWDEDEDWVQPFLAAAKRDSLELVELLLDYGADVNVQCFEHFDYGIEESYDRALLWAVHESQEAIVNLLLERGADPETSDETGQPVLTHAVYRESEALIRSLLDHGANPHQAVDHRCKKLMSFRQMKQSTWAMLQEAEVEWTKQHPS
ncbi:hypothetical protein N7471_009097 [Penicillium samsonianum]|uniref:uncharacterized protein n=1 Tax=Penicillium samsonianum TaxID=1882272 RepID=UPI00254739E4|nr:uncharacterized protein N7471_009097 [Penicillium samsonianum]KAJ6127880.1 hypothetical protein N7471_009097 [Penicillium samsonianum]